MIPGKGRRFDIVLDQNYMYTTPFSFWQGGRGGGGWLCDFILLGLASYLDNKRAITDRCKKIITSKIAILCSEMK